MSDSFNPYAVTLARRAKGMLQADVAEAVGVTQASVSYWERGLRVPEPEILDRLASELDVLPLTLVDESIATTTPMFRATGVDRKKDERKIEGRTELARLAASRILEEVDVAPALMWPSEEDPLGDDPEDAAAALRRVWRIPNGPIANLTTFIESAGAVILRVDFGHPKVEAAYAHPRRDAKRWILVNTYMQDSARHRLTLAHELGHAVLHHWDAFNVPDERGREAQAYRFALALMVPAEDFTLDIINTRRSWDDFLRLRDKWGVSAAALARRAHDLKLLDAGAYKSLNITRRSRGHWKHEPGQEVALEQPTVFPEAVSVLREQAHWTDTDFSEAAGLPLRRLADLLPEDFAVQEAAPPATVTLRRIK
jgi:Zn-dependent peptidase ImmA (M78 family)/transcriptional regulator with XRE-family HTH domain